MLFDEKFQEKLMMLIIKEIISKMDFKDLMNEEEEHDKKPNPLMFAKRENTARKFSSAIPPDPFSTHLPTLGKIEG